MAYPDRSAEYIVATLLIIIGVVLSACLATLLLEQSDNLFLLTLRSPGMFMWRSFHGAAFLIPLFFFIVGFSVFKRSPTYRDLFVLIVYVFPFFTVGLALRLLFDAPNVVSPITRWAIESFTRNGGAVLFLLLTAAQMIGIFYIGKRIGVSAGAASSNRSDDKEPEVRHSDIGALIEAGKGFVESAAPSYADDESADTTEEAVAPVDTGHIETVNGEASNASGASGASANADADANAADTEAAHAADADADPDATAENMNLYFGHGQFSMIAEKKNDSQGHGADRDWASQQYWSVDRSTDNQAIDDTTDEEYDRWDRDDDGDWERPRCNPIRYRRHRPRLPATMCRLRGLLEHSNEIDLSQSDGETTKAAELLRQTLQEFNIEATVTGIRRGPVITMFELLPAPGVKLARITNLADNIALRLAAKSVRIVAPIPGKRAVGIEIPNRHRHTVRFGDLVRQPPFGEAVFGLPIVLGRNIPGEAQIIDLVRTPHLLIAGATGSGKSVCVNAIICSLLFRRSPSELRLLLIDPKIVELKLYNDIPHLLTPVITDPKRALKALQHCIHEMERRYVLLDSMGVRDILAYNRRIRERAIAATALPYLVVVIDEFADLMAVVGKELESTLARLAAMSRAVGIHLVLATQRPSTDVITGLIKANIPSRIAFMVSSKIDSRIILDGMGAEQLLGQGDMLFTSSWQPFPERIQGALLTEEEVEAIADHVRTLGEPDYLDEEIFGDEQDEEIEAFDVNDPLMEEVLEIVQSSRKASASYLQRRLKIGYNRAARIIELLEQRGIVGPANGSKPREVLV